MNKNALLAFILCFSLVGHAKDKRGPGFIDAPAYVQNLKHQGSVDSALQAVWIHKQGLQFEQIVRESSPGSQIIDRQQYRDFIITTQRTLMLLREQQVAQEDQLNYQLALDDAEKGMQLMQQSEAAFEQKGLFKKTYCCC